METYVPPPNTSHGALANLGVGFMEPSKGWLVSVWIRRFESILVAWPGDARWVLMGGTPPVFIHWLYFRDLPLLRSAHGVSQKGLGYLEAYCLPACLLCQLYMKANAWLGRVRAFGL